MDPAAITLAIKALDAAFVIGQYMVRRAESAKRSDEMEDALSMIHGIRLQLSAGDITAEQAEEDLDALLEQTLKPMREAIDRL